MKAILRVLLLLVGCSTAYADGLTVNIPVVGRVFGAGGVLFRTAVDVANNGNQPAAVDFSFDAKDAATGDLISVRGTIGSFGIVDRGTGVMRARSCQHFDDFIDDLVGANLLAAKYRDDGLLGSLMLVFNGYTKRGQGSAVARFYNSFGGGNVSVALRGHEIAANEPQKLVVTARDTTGTADPSPLYSNLFINNTGLTPAGAATDDKVTIELSATDSGGNPIGNKLAVAIESGQTANIGHIFQALGIAPNEVTTTILVFATVTSGNAAIEGLISQVDTVTKDGAAFEMTRADF